MRRQPLLLVLLPLLAGMSLMRHPLMNPTAQLLTGAVALLCIAVSHGLPSRRSTSFIFTVSTGLLFFVLGHTWAHHAWQSTLWPLPSTPHYYQGVITDVPTSKPRTWACMVRTTAQIDSTLTTFTPLHHTVLLYLQCDSTDVAPRLGDTLTFRARMESTAHPHFWQGASHALYHRTHGIAATAYVRKQSMHQGALLPHSRLDAFTALRLRLLQLRCRFTQHLSQHGLPTEVEALLRALSVGDRTHLTPSTRQVFNEAGASHVLALSGMHLALLVGLFILMIPPAWRHGRGRWMVCGGLLLTVWTYVLLAGMPLSLVRSAVMCSLQFMLWDVMERRSSLSLLWFTALLVSLVTPMALYDAGCQLSFMAVAGILWLYLPLQSRIRSWFWVEDEGHHPVRKVCEWTCQCCTLSVCAQVMVTPLVLHYFHQLPTYFWLTSLWISLFAFPFMVIAWLLMLFPTSLGLMEPLSHIAQQLYHTAHLLLLGTGHLPFAHTPPITLSWSGVAALYALLGMMVVAVKYGRRHLASFLNPLRP